jgi:hypothetical protein
MKYILADSSFLYTLYDAAHPQNAIVKETAQLRAITLMIPDVVLTETAYLFRRAGGVIAVIRFLDTLRAAKPVLEPVGYEDLDRARDIMGIYASANLDFVDCCLMAIAERLKITQVCTFDHRDFSIFRPQHCDYLEILP